MSLRKSQRNKNLAYGVIAAFIVSCVGMSYHLAAGIAFNRDFGGYLKRAADANSLEIADHELSRAIAYLRTRNLDTEEGRNLGWHADHTSILYETPDEQLSFFYNNLVESQRELQAVMASGTATPTDRSNLLLKLRETLIDHGKEGDSVTYPSGLDVYPNNGRLMLLILIPALLAGLFFLMMDYD